MLSTTFTYIEFKSNKSISNILKVNKSNTSYIELELNWKIKIKKTYETRKKRDSNRN